MPRRTIVGRSRERRLTLCLISGTILRDMPRLALWFREDSPGAVCPTAFAKEHRDSCYVVRISGGFS